MGNMSACSTLFYTCSTCPTCSSVALLHLMSWAGPEQSGGPSNPIHNRLAASSCFTKYVSANLEEAGIGSGLWAPLQISSSRETASGRATHGPSTQTFNIVLDLSTGKLNPIIRVSEVNKIIFTDAFQSCLGVRGIWSNCLSTRRTWISTAA